MRLHRLSISIFLIILSMDALRVEAATFEGLCPRVYIEKIEDFGFNDNEKKFICGDPGRNAWKEIPYSQARYHVRTFLQDRGYFSPHFIVRRGDLIVLPGKKSIITKIDLVGAPPVVNIRRRRNLMRTTLKPETLSLMENWVESRLKAKGYPCPDIVSEGDADTGEVTLNVDAGPFQRLVGIEEESVRGLHRGVLRRYDAFRMGKPYNQDFLTVTANRTIDDGIVENTYFTTDCSEEGAKTYQHVIPGKPRIVNFGFGASTEEYGIVKGSWRHGRLGSHGSTFEVTGYGSYRTQRLETQAHWYFLDPKSRWHFRPLASFAHENEPKYRHITSEFYFTPATSWDSQNLGLQAVFGPKFTLTKTYMGPTANQGLLRFLSMSTDLTLMSHYFEFYRTSPRRGFRVNFTGDFNHSSLLSTVTAQRLGVLGEVLWNFKKLDPPLFIFGLRGGYFTTAIDNTAGNLLRLPPNYRHFLGGSRDLRGFSRQELPDSSLGALTAAFAGLEIRSTGVLPFNLQPFIFLDAGALSDKSFALRAPVFLSPGFGLRWESPVGVLRGSFAHGFMVGSPSGNFGSKDVTHPQFLLTFGEEF